MVLFGQRAQSTKCLWQCGRSVLWGLRCWVHHLPQILRRWRNCRQCGDNCKAVGAENSSFDGDGLWHEGYHMQLRRPVGVFVLVISCVEWLSCSGTHVVPNFSKRHRNVIGTSLIIEVGLWMSVAFQNISEHVGLLRWTTLHIFTLQSQSTNKTHHWFDLFRLFCICFVESRFFLFLPGGYAVASALRWKEADLWAKSSPKDLFLNGAVAGKVQSGGGLTWMQQLVSWRNEWWAALSSHIIWYYMLLGPETHGQVLCHEHI